MSPPRTVGMYLIEALEHWGVQHVFGIPGVHNIELYRGLVTSGIRHISGRHEQGLGFMADGYARTCGRPGVCFTITGPGVSNIATAMAQAYGDSIPMVVIASQNRRGEISTGRGFLHEMPDQLGLAQRVSGLAVRVETPTELPDAIDQAFSMQLRSRPRPAYLEIPRDVLALDAGELPAPRAAPGSIGPRLPAVADVAEAARRLANARRVVILAGGGAVKAATQLQLVAELLSAPVVMTVNARGLLPPEHPLGLSASPSLEAVRTLVTAADVVLAVGTEVGPTDYDMYSTADFPQPPDLIRIDIDEQQLNRSVAPALALTGDSSATLSALASCILKAMPDGHSVSMTSAASVASTAQVAAVRARVLQEIGPTMQGQVQLLDYMRAWVHGATMVGDSTQLVYAGNLAYAAASPGSWFNSATGFGTLGYALPASTGASLAAPDRPVICLVGDGGLQFTLGELAGPRDLGTWSAVVVWNNGGYQEIKTSMQAAGIAPAGVDVLPPDLGLLARAYGYVYRRVTSLRELETALRDFASRRQVMLVDVVAHQFV